MYALREFGAVEIVMLRVATALVLPAASLAPPAATVMTAVPPTVPDAVNVAEYEVPDPVKPLRVPNVAVMSEASKPVTVSLKVNVTVVDPPGANDVAPPKVIVGAVASRMIVPSALAGAASVLFEESTATVYR